MSNRWASSQKAHGFCDRCGLRYALKRLKKLTIKVTQVNILVCPSCWEESHPQLMLGMYPVDDPQALRNPRPDNTYWQGGMTGLQVSNEVPPDNVLAFGSPSSGSRVIQWGWNPVGLNNAHGLPGLVDVMEMHGQIGQVEVDTSKRSVELDGVVAGGAVGSVEGTTTAGTPGGDQGIGTVGTVTVQT